MLRLARARPDSRITAIDGSAAMIELAREAVRASGQGACVVPIQGRIPGLALDEHSFDAILSKDLMYHLPDSAVLWNEARHCRDGGAPRAPGSEGIRAHSRYHDAAAALTFS